jgi:hypothetical protein
MPGAQEHRQKHPGLGQSETVTVRSPTPNRLQEPARRFQRLAFSTVRDFGRMEFTVPVDRARADRVALQLERAAWFIGNNPLPNPRRLAQVRFLSAMAFGIVNAATS